MKAVYFIRKAAICHRRKKELLENNSLQSFVLSAAFILSIFFAASFSDTFAQVNQRWKWVHPTPQGNVLTWCKMWDASTWYIVGQTGTFMKTTNAGINWYITQNAGALVYAGTSYGDIWDAYFFNQNTGILAGNYVLTKTTDGGNTFETIPSTFFSNTLWRKIFFLNNNTGYAVAGYGPVNNRLAKTTNGGNNWSISTTLPVGPSYTGIYTPDDTLIIVSTASSGNIMRSTDSGLSWTAINTGTSYGLNVLQFINRDTGFVATTGFISMTTNGGLNWTPINTGLPSSAYFDIDFKATGNNRYIYLTGNRDYIYKTSNFGASWEQVDFKPSNQSFSGSYYSTELGGGDSLLTVGVWGLINKRFSPLNNILYTNFVKFGGGIYLFDVWAESGNGKVWVVGWPSIPGSTFDQIMYSSNGGISWSIQPSPSSSVVYTSIQMLNVNTGYITGSNNTGTIGSVLKTTSGGVSWNPLVIPSVPGLQKVVFTDINTGWVFGNSGAIFKTTDGGASWVQQTAAGVLGNIRGASMINANMGWFAAGDLFNGSVFKTTNGGINWVDQTPAGIRSLYDIQMLNANTGYVCGLGVGGAVRKTTNGGNTWDSIATPFTTAQYISVKFADSLNGFIASSNGTIRTTDGGQNWEFDLFPHFIINLDNIGHGKIFLASMDTLFASGSNCGVYKYTSNSPIGITSWENTVPEKYELYQNYPNPFNPTTIIKFAILNPGNVTLKVYDITGREVKTILDNLQLNRGTVKHTFDGSELASGIYFYSLYIDGEMMDSKKMLLIK